jgi:site-specific recombinase XerD
VAPYFELRTLQAALDARPQSSDEFVFISRNQGRLHRSQIFRIFQGAAQDAGLPRTKQHYHCCKHSAAVSMLKHGASMPEVQKRFGWKSLATVGRYLAVSDETADIAADKAEKQFAQSCAAQSRHKLS